MDYQQKEVYFSVLIPVYNGSHCISRSIRSVQNQTFSDFELIICDDASTDDTQKTVKTAAENDSRLKLITHKNNTGALIARNDLIRSAKGKYCVFVDADDELLPDFLEHGRKILSSKEYDIIQFSFYSTGAPVHSIKRMGYFSDLELFGKNVIWNHLFGFPVIFAPFAKIYSKKLLIKALPKDMELRFIDDIPLTLRASAYAETYLSVKKKEYVFHYGEGNFSKAQWSQEKIHDFCKASATILEDFRELSKNLSLEQNFCDKLEEHLENNLFNQIMNLPPEEKASAIRVYLQFFEGKRLLKDFFLINKYTPLSAVLKGNLKFSSLFLKRLFFRIVGKKKWIEP